MPEHKFVYEPSPTADQPLDMNIWELMQQTSVKLHRIRYLWNIAEAALPLPKREEVLDDIKKANRAHLAARQFLGTGQYEKGKEYFETAYRGFAEVVYYLEIYLFVGSGYEHR